MHKRNIDDMIHEMHTKIGRSKIILDEKKSIRKKTYRFVRNLVLIGAVGYASCIGVMEYIENKPNVDRYVIEKYEVAVDYANDLKNKF